MGEIEIPEDSDHVESYFVQALPMNSVMSVEIEDREQLNGFAETSKAFADREKVRFTRKIDI